MTTSTVPTKAAETWPVTPDGWVALIGAMRDRAQLVFGPKVADLVHAHLRIAERLIGTVETGTAGRMSRADVNALVRLYGPIIAEVRGQPGRTAAAPQGDDDRG